MYPDGLGGAPYAERFDAAAIQRYRALGIDRDDPDRPRNVAALNTDAFGASVVLFCYPDPVVGLGQRADAGRYLQTITLLLRAEGLHSCTHLMWTMYRRTVSDVVAVEGLVLLCGVAVGYEDEAVPRLRTARADDAETVAFVGS